MSDKDLGQEVAVDIDDVLDDQPELPLVEAVKAEPEVKPEDPKPAVEEKPVDPVEDMKAQLAAERQRIATLQAERDRAIAVAQEQRRQAMAAAGNQKVSQYNLFVNSLEAAKVERENIKREIANAFEIGDGKAAADLQERLAETTVRIRDLGEGIERMEEDHRAQTQRQAAQAQQRQTPVRQPVNAFEAQIAHLSEPSKAWIRAHPDAMTDPAKASRLAILDGAAKYQGIEPDSPAYFAFFESNLGYRQPVSDNRQTAKPNYAAPVSRDSGRVPDSPTRVRLTREQVAMAAELGMTNEEYAKGLIMTQKQRGER